MTLNVIKIGGSLAQDPKVLKTLCQKLSLLANRHQIIVVVPGGGKFAQCVREADEQFSLSETTAHHMAILGMDQYGLLLADLMPNCQIAINIREVKNAICSLIVFLPSKFMHLKEGLPNSWEVTSDSIAAYIAEKLEATKLLLIKNVDGIFTGDPKKNAQTKLLEHLTVEELAKMENNTCTDLYLPKLLTAYKINCHIVNGFYPGRIKSTLNKQKTTGTIIS